MIRFLAIALLMFGLAASPVLTAYCHQQTSEIASADNDPCHSNSDSKSDHAAHCCAHSHIISGYHILADAELQLVLRLASFQLAGDGFMFSRTVPPLLEPPSLA